MFSANEKDKYITFAHLVLLVKYLEAHPVRERTSDMLSAITRNGDEYTLHVTVGSHSGYGHKFKIVDTQVVDLGISGVWMH